MHIEQIPKTGLDSNGYWNGFEYLLELMIGIDSNSNNHWIWFQWLLELIPVAMGIDDWNCFQ